MPESALDRLKRLSAWDKTPALTSDDLEAILAGHATVDANSVKPDEDGWIPTYRINKAIAEAWDMKAGLAAEFVSTDMNDTRLSSNQVFEQCERMARRYRNRGSATFSIAAGG